ADLSGRAGDSDVDWGLGHDLSLLSWSLGSVRETAPSRWASNAESRPNRVATSLPTGGPEVGYHPLFAPRCRRGPRSRARAVGRRSGLPYDTRSGITRYRKSGRSPSSLGTPVMTAGLVGATKPSSAFSDCTPVRPSRRYCGLNAMRIGSPSNF